MVGSWVKPWAEEWEAWAAWAAAAAPLPNAAVADAAAAATAAAAVATTSVAATRASSKAVSKFAAQVDLWFMDPAPDRALLPPDHTTHRPIHASRRTHPSVTCQAATREDQWLTLTPTPTPTPNPT